jgi:hypothetical protein
MTAPAVLVRPNAPERHQENAEHEDQRGEDAGERGDLGVREADLVQSQRQEGEDLADPGRLDQRRDGVDREERAPILDRALR